MPLFNEAFQLFIINYLKENADKFTSMETGVYEIDGQNIYAQVIDTVTGALEDQKPEVHKRYVDVQFLASGQEVIGYTHDTGSYKIVEELEHRDLYYIDKVDHESWMQVVPGCYNMFFPYDVHRPGVMVDEPMKVRKVVVKVLYELL